MPNQVITVNRKKYAVGLLWQPIGAGFVARNYARNLARSIDKKLNLFTEYRMMIAMGSKKYGHRSGMPSLAAEIMDSLTEYNSFLGVFLADKFFYLIAVRNGVVLQDKIFEDAAAARAEYFRLSEIPDWNALFAPADWGMPRAVERNLNELTRVNAHAVLRPISRLGGGIISLAILLVFFVIISAIFREPIGQMFHSTPNVAEINPELAAEYKRQIEEKNRELDAQYNIEKPAPIEHPYDFLPEVDARAEVCFRAIGFLMQPIVGWQQTSVECGEVDAVATFKRTYSTVGDFYNLQTELMPGTFVSQINDDTIIVRAILPTVGIMASQDERDAESVVRDVITAFQAMNVPVDVETVVDVLTNGVETEQINVVEISAQSKLVPMQFMQIFNNFGGVYMTRCAWNVAQRTWNYEVIIYAK